MGDSLPYVLFQVAALLGAIGQALYKIAVDWKTKGRAPLHLGPMFGGILVYCGALVLFVLAFRAGGQMGVLYATYSTTFVWSLVIARLWFGERITAQKVAGVTLIAGGICCVALL
jgi:multidrug transporter EmrE-like cation transporter